MKKFTIAAQAMLVVLFAAGSSPAVTLIDLGTLGGPQSSANAINDAGQIVGSAEVSEGLSHAFLYESGVMTDLGTLGGESSANLINDSGQIAGDSAAPGGNHAFLYSGGVMTDLGTLGGDFSSALAMNNLGEVVGTSKTAGGDRHAFLYSGGVMTDLGTFGGPESGAFDINDAGQIVGYADVATNTEHPFLYSGGMMMDLGTLGGDEAYAQWINEAGLIVGGSLIGSGMHPLAHVFTSTGGPLTDIGVLEQSKSMDPRGGLNASGQIVGEAYVSGYRGYVYSGGAMTDIGTIGGQTGNYMQINDAGQVTATSETAPQSQDLHAVIYSHGTLTDLGALGGDWSVPLGLNASGQVVGTSGEPFHLHAFLRNPVCGDGIVDPGEQCDDGNLTNGDCCASDCTYHGPATTCMDGPKASLSIGDSADDRKDKLMWKWRGGGAFAQGDLGNPVSSTTYTLCITDSTGGVDRLIASMRIDPSASWIDNSPGGLKYKDKTGVHAGVTTAKIATGDAAKTKVQIKARGANIAMPAPFSASEFADLDSRVTVQLFNDASSTCWSSEFTTAKKNTATSFKALKK